MIRETMKAQRPRSRMREMILLQILQILKRKQHSIINNFSTQQVNNLDEMDNFLESLRWPEFTQVETE